MDSKPGDCWRREDGAPFLLSVLPKSEDDAAELVEGAAAAAMESVLPNRAEVEGFLTVPRFGPLMSSAHTSTVVGRAGGFDLTRLAAGVKSLAAGERSEAPADGAADGFATLWSSA